MWRQFTPENIKNKLSILGAMSEMGLDYDVTTGQAFVQFNPDHDTSAVKAVENNYFLYRTDSKQVFGTCKGRYTPLHNIDAFSWAQCLIGEGLIEVESGGILNGGVQAFMTFKIKSGQFIIDCINHSDRVELYLLIINGHDGSTSLQAGIIPFRLACANMLRKSKKHMQSFKHTESVLAAAEVIRYMIKSTIYGSNEVIASYNELAISKFTDFEAIEYFRKVFNINTETTRGKNTMDRIFNIYDGQTNENIRGTKWGAYNAATEYLNYEYGRSQENRVSNLLLTDSGERAYSLILAA